MTDRGSPGAYRDELVAAQSRIAALEEKLADRGDGEDDDDPETALLLQQRRALVRQAKRGTGPWATLVVALVPLMFPVALALGHPHPSYDDLVALTLAFGAVGAVFAAAVYFVARSGARSALPRLDAKIADARRKRDEARRLRTIERELVEMRRSRKEGAATGGSALRVAVEDEVEVEEDEDEAGEALGRARRR